MSTRDEILAALTEAPDGLTSKELAPLCPSAECDPMIVGRVIATLRSENVLHPGTEFRDGATIWIFGAEKVEETEAHVSVPFRPPSDTPNRRMTEAAHSIADMRRQATATARRAPDRAQPPVTTPAPARAVDHQETSMKKEEKPLAERIVEALGKHGALNLDDLAKKANTTKATLYTMMGSLEKHHGVVRVSRGVYDLRGAAKDEPSKPRVPPKKVNGNGHGSIYAEALNGLQEKRAVLADELAKVDRAIEAVGALA